MIIKTLVNPDQATVCWSPQTLPLTIVFNHQNLQ